MENFNKIVLNIPHSSTKFPSKEDLDKWDSDIEAENKLMCDTMVDMLFSTGNKKIEVVKFPYSRFYCDVERLINDPMENIGQGIIYTNFNDKKRILTKEEKNKILNIYYKYIELLKEKISNNTLLIDCHSFNSELSDIDLCIGYNEDWSKPSENTINFIENFFLARGLKVEKNKPYSNSISPSINNIEYKSIMLEFNKKYYLNGQNETNNFLYKKNMVINELYNKLLNEA